MNKEFEWDKERDRQNRRKHGIVFCKALPEFHVRKRMERIDFVHKFRSRETISFVLVEEWHISIRLHIHKIGPGVLRRGKESMY